MNDGVLNEQQYADGFNAGVWLFGYERELAASFIEQGIVQYDDFSTGFSEGLVQAEYDRTLSEMHELRAEYESPTIDHDREPDF